VWMSIATTSSILGSFSLGISLGSRRLMIALGKLIILYNEFGK
jgi:hypothetical protein